MAGIAAYGAYIPWYRLSRGAIARAWDNPPAPGEKAIAGYDEDTLTMAVEAGIDCLSGREREKVDGLFFASTTSPFKEKQTASIAATAIDLPQRIITEDYAGSLRAGTSALRAALDAVRAGTAKNVVVTASESRLPYPQSPLENSLGDGAASLLVSDSGVIATLEGYYSLSSSFIDLWRLEGDRYIRQWEDRFIITEGYQRILPQAVGEALKKFGLQPKDISKAAFYGPDGRNHAGMARTLGFDPRSQVQDSLFDEVGNTGSALPLMLFAAALEDAKPGDRILLASYGDGSDVFLFRVTEEIKKVKRGKGVRGHIASKKVVNSYEKYILFRGLMPVDPPALPPFLSSLPVSWRDEKSLIRLHGNKCRQCGQVQFPAERLCIKCGAKDNSDEVRLSDKKGTIFSFNADYVTLTYDPPSVLTVVDFEGGGRIQCVMADKEHEAVKVGMPVEMTFRKFHQERGVPNYYWKSRPVR